MMYLKNTITRRTILIGAGLATIPLISTAQASDWPKRPVKLVLPFTPGGSDVMFRLMAPKLSEMWKQPVVLEHKPGASNIVATDLVVKAKPDGYTIGVTGATVANNPLFYKRIPYTYDDFVGVSRLVNIEMVVVVRDDAPFNSIPELVIFAKKNPGALTWGTGGLGATYVGFLHFMDRAGIKMVHVNFQGTPQAHNELLAGRIDLVVNPFAASDTFVRARRMKVLAGIGAKRLANAPQTPTVSDTYPGVEITPYYALIAPKGTPADIVEKIYRDSATVLKQPKMQAQLKELGLTIITTTPVETDKFFRTETEMWKRIAIQINLPPPD